MSDSIDPYEFELTTKEFLKRKRKAEYQKQKEHDKNLRAEVKLEKRETKMREKRKREAAILSTLKRASELGEK